MRVICVFLIVCATITSFIIGAPIGDDLISYENVQTEDGYRFSYETKDGQAREEVGTIDPSTGVLRVTGWYSYYTPDGVMHRVDFVADENGYRVESEPSSVEEEFTPNVEAGPIDRTVLLSLVG
ncbi:larval cuticle protein 16/17-like [Anopheles arabiensis]|uniref:Uncharacterized protein n=1 Tax=Anopheles arabiensis TaxID=7173 RepID=A0A453YKC7_ANOAR|nr:larval cuticle protein 16/17-like [Anopheles arabiensis]